MLSVVGDIPVDSGAPVVTSSILRICQLSLSEVLIEVGLRACIHRDEYVCVFVSVCTMFFKKKIVAFSEALHRGAECISMKWCNFPNILVLLLVKLNQNHLLPVTYMAMYVQILTYMAMFADDLILCGQANM